MTTAEDVERLRAQVVDLERVLLREGAVEASYERQLAQALRERDEARAEVKRTYREMRDLMGAHKAAERSVAERQREACALEVHRWPEARIACRATPLVTEEDK